jgi:phospholipid-binding lipoprotein MlaA
MRKIATFLNIVSFFLLAACASKGSNPVDPYESTNREIHKFNMAFDATMLKPPARVYQAVLPLAIRTGIGNAFNNVLMPSIIINDFLQAEWVYVIKDSWRFLINSTVGFAGFLDVADKGFCLPPHYNDLGITFARWGAKNSAYLVIPLIGPSTIRDGIALPINYLFTPYPYLTGGVLFVVAPVRYVDLRSQLLETDPLINQSIDKYTFIRDAYLQHRSFLITGEKQDTEDGAGYVNEEEVTDYVD